jgi:hypothetical protein
VGVAVNYLSDVNLRAVLAVLIGRAGGSVEISNEELYGAMIGPGGQHDGFEINETPTGVQITRRSGARRDVDR